jgi:hypothetical protein
VRRPGAKARPQPQGDGGTRRRGDLARGGSDEARQAANHRGRLFSSGLVAGEVILGVAIDGLLVTGLELPRLEGTRYTKELSWLRDIVSLAALFLVAWLLVRKCKPGAAAGA